MRGSLYQGKHPRSVESSTSGPGLLPVYSSRPARPGPCLHGTSSTPPREAACPLPDQSSRPSSIGSTRPRRSFCTGVPAEPGRGRAMYLIGSVCGSRRLAPTVAARDPRHVRRCLRFGGLWPERGSPEDLAASGVVRAVAAGGRDVDSGAASTARVGGCSTRGDRRLRRSRQHGAAESMAVPMAVAIGCQWSGVVMRPGRDTLPPVAHKLIRSEHDMARGRQANEPRPLAHRARLAP